MRRLTRVVSLTIVGLLSQGEACAESLSGEIVLDKTPRAGINGWSTKVLRNDDSGKYTSIGDIFYRRAAFEAAGTAYQRALSANPNCARAYLGLGRLEKIQFRRTSARDLIATAFRLDPYDPEIILEYVDFVASRESRAILYRNIVELTKNFDADRATEALAHLQIERRRPAVHAAQAMEKPVFLKLAPLAASGGGRGGMVLEARINGDTRVRLLVDTGASGIILDPKAARGVDLENVTEARIDGVGGRGEAGARVAVARTVSFGDLQLRDCLVEVSPKPLTSGVDGVVGTDTFDDFAIRIQPAARTLELIPLQTSATTASATPFYGVGHLILVKVSVDRRDPTLFLLDTGAALTSVSKDLVEILPGSRVIPISGADGASVYGQAARAVRLEFPGVDFVEPRPVALSLAEISRRAGVQVSGILGYSVLHNYDFTINYKAGMIRIGSAQ